MCFWVKIKNRDFREIAQQQVFSKKKSSIRLGTGFSKKKASLIKEVL